MEGLSYEEIFGHIKVLCEDFSHRHTGEVHEAEAAKYIQNAFRQTGLTASIWETSLMGWELIQHPRLEIITPEAHEIECAPFIFSGSTPPEGLCGELVYIGPTAVVGAYLWEKWALVDPRTNQTTAYIVGNSDGPIMTQPGPPSGFAGTEDGPHYTWPSCIISSSDEKRLKSWKEKGMTITARYFVETKYKPGVKGHTVEAFLPGTGCEDKEIVIGAHHDTQGAIGFPAAIDSPGGVDNASGVAVVLALARYFKERPLPIGLRFCTFGGEEWNSTLSKDWVRLKMERGLIHRIKAYVNLDQAANGEHINIFCSSAELAPAMNMETIARSILADLSLDQKYPVKFITPPFGSSDHWAFYKAGIPVIWTCWHNPKDYHRAGDNLSNCLSPDRCLAIAEFDVEGIKRITALLTQ